MNRAYRTAYLLVLILGPLVLLCVFLVYMQSQQVMWVAANTLAFLDNILGAWGLLPPIASWALMGFLIGAAIHFAVWEIPLLDMPRVRWALIATPCILLVLVPIAWSNLEFRVSGPATLPQTQNFPQPGETRTFFGIECVWVPPGRFHMGSPAEEPGHETDEQAHLVTLTHGFWLGRYEVTRGQWRAVMGDTPTAVEEGEESYPVDGVSWNDCQAFIAKLNTPHNNGFRLPAEAEWEYACRANNTGAYTFGDDSAKLADYAWFADNSDAKPHPVGQKQPNAWGLYDMHGNVLEWCQDWHGDYPSTRLIDPAGPATGICHVLHGGAWSSPPAACRAARRLVFIEGYFVDKRVLGFRVAKTFNTQDMIQPASTP